jgi:hypothetical protein
MTSKPLEAISGNLGKRLAVRPVEQCFNTWYRKKEITVYAGDPKGIFFPS